jgi:hypothetical protein
MLTKYTWQFRRAYPLLTNAAFDMWDFIPTTADHTESWDRMHHEMYHGRCEWFEETPAWSLNDVDWGQWEAEHHCSMLAPRRNSVSYYGRTVVALTFAAFCWLLRHQCSVSEVEDAWRLSLPIVAFGKAARGCNAGKWYQQNWK